MSNNLETKNRLSKYKQIKTQDPWDYDRGLAVGQSQALDWVCYGRELARRNVISVFDQLKKLPFLELGGGWSCSLRKTVEWFGAPSYTNIDECLGFGSRLFCKRGETFQVTDSYSIPTFLNEIDMLAYLQKANGPFNVGVCSVGHGLSYTSSEYNHLVCTELGRVIQQGGLLLATNAPIVDKISFYGFREVEPEAFGGDDYTSEFEKSRLFIKDEY